MKLVTFALVCCACYYLLARAEVTRWFWEPLDKTVLGKLFRCPACTGFWLGFVLGHIIPTNGHPYGPAWNHVASLSCLTTSVRHAAYGIVLTAITWALMKVALDYGHAPEPEEEPHALADREAHPEE